MYYSSFDCLVLDITLASYKLINTTMLSSGKVMLFKIGVINVIRVSDSETTTATFSCVSHNKEFLGKTNPVE